MTTRTGWLLPAALVLGGSLLTFGAEQSQKTGTVQFNRDIRPILSDNCFSCHGPDPATRKAGLRLDTKEGLFDVHENSVPVVKGKADESELYRRISSTDADELMPPPRSHKKLKGSEKELIRRWITEGAPWEPHWSLAGPTRPTPPVVKNSAWVKNPIDRFVLAKLEALQLAPAAEADRRTLIRRLYLDQTGL